MIRRAKQASRRKFSAEEKIRVVMDGIRAEVSVANLCRREGIHPTIYYKWLKDFMEADKGRLRGDAKREATSYEVQDLRQENERLKLLVADLSLENLTLKKASIRASGPEAVRTNETREEAGSDRVGTGSPVAKKETLAVYAQALTMANQAAHLKLVGLI